MQDRLYGEPCAYCGEPSQAVDHIPPVIHRDMIPEADWYCVPVCYECNNGLGARFLLTFVERVEFIKVWLRQRHRSALETVDRTEKELKEYGPSLRRRLKRALRVKATVIARLQYRGIAPKLPYYKDSRF